MPEKKVTRGGFLEAIPGVGYLLAKARQHAAISRGSTPEPLSSEAKFSRNSGVILAAFLSGAGVVLYARQEEEKSSMDGLISEFIRQIDQDAVLIDPRPLATDLLKWRIQDTEMSIKHEPVRQAAKLLTGEDQIGKLDPVVDSLRFYQSRSLSNGVIVYANDNHLSPIQISDGKNSALIPVCRTNLPALIFIRGYGDPSGLPLYYLTATLASIRNHAAYAQNMVDRFREKGYRFATSHPGDLTEREAVSIAAAHMANEAGKQGDSTTILDLVGMGGHILSIRVFDDWSRQLITGRAVPDEAVQALQMLVGDLTTRGIVERVNGRLEWVGGVSPVPRSREFYQLVENLLRTPAGGKIAKTNREIYEQAFTIPT